MAKTSTALLARALLSEGLSVSTGALALEISEASMSRILGGKQTPRLRLRRKIARRFGVPVASWPGGSRIRLRLEQIASGGDAA